MRTLSLSLLVAATLAACGGADSSGNGSNATDNSAATPVGTTTGPAGAMVDPHAQSYTAVAAADTSAPSPGCYKVGTPRRLTRDQVVNALSDVTVALTGDTSMPAKISTLVKDTAQFPPDTAVNPVTDRHLGYERLDVNLNSRQVGALRDTAQSLAATLTADSTKLSALLGTCTGTGDECVTAFIRKAGRLLFRQPLTDAEVNIYRTAAGNSNSASGVAKALASMIASPKFYFVLEKGQTSTTSATCTPLTAHELASRMALHFWNSVPDAALNAVADSGALLKQETYTAQIQRMMADARSDRALRELFAGWFRLNELVAMNGQVGTAKFDTFAGDFKPLATTRDAAITEVLDMVSWLAARNGSLQQVLTDRHSFARTADIAALYKTNVWDGTSTPPLFSEANRVGLLTRIGFVAQGATALTSPIQRGAKILYGLTCAPMPTPAQVQTNAKADLTGVLTTRQRTERVTEMPSTACVGCHKTQMNPWGFAMEGFDALGRYRQVERVLDDSGKSLGEKPVVTAAIAALANTPSRAIGSAAEAQQYILESGQLESCFAKNYVRYSFGRGETAADSALIESLRQQAANGANLRSLFSSIALRTEFTTIQRP